MKREKFTGAALAALLFFGGVAAGVLANRYYATTTVSAKASETYRHRYVAEMESKFLPPLRAAAHELGLLLAR